MKKKLLIIESFLLLFSPLIGQISRIDTTDILEKKLEAQSIIVFRALQDTSYQKAAQFFSQDLQEKLDSALLFKTWWKITETNSCDSVIDFGVKKTAESVQFLRGFACGTTSYDLTFTINENNQWKSLRINPYVLKSYQLPNYLQQVDYLEKELNIGNSLPLKAKFTSLKGEQNLPIVVMVHGSGPNDMDESLGPNKLFKELAVALANKGIASLRYNKRTYDYPSETMKRINSLDINYEVVDDAVAAIETAKNLTDGKVILLGHSLGGYLAPMIVENKTVEGVIVMAGPVSPLEDLLINQLDYLRSNDSTSGISDFMYNSLKWQVNNLKEGNYDSSTVGANLPFSLPGVYWLSLKNYSPDSIVTNQEMPYLILNGGRDYQVPITEAKSWNNGNHNPYSKTIIYPKLNHMFFEGEGLTLPAEYEQKANISLKVIDDITKWITQLH